jgi:polar amino acid transport system substrate-binding protein
MLVNKLVLVFIVTFVSNLYAGETWKIASLNWEPYAGSQLINQGSSIQKLRELLKKEDITLIVEFFPWKRAKQLVKNNSEYMAIFPAWPEDVFPDSILSPAVDWSEIAILKRAQQELSFNSIDELFKKYSVGVVSTYIYPPVFEDAIETYPHHAESAPNELSLLKKLAFGRQHSAITDPNVMFYFAAREGISNLEVVNIVMEKELVLALRDDKENRRRLKIITKLLKESENP